MDDDFQADDDETAPPNCDRHDKSDELDTLMTTLFTIGGADLPTTHMAWRQQNARQC